MAESSLNNQIVDAVAATSFINISGAPASAQALLDAVMSETLGMAMHNAVMRQQASSVVSSAATTATCARILQSGNGDTPPAPPPFIPMPGPVIPPLDGPGDIDIGYTINTAQYRADVAIDTLENQANIARNEETGAQSALNALNLKLNGLMGKPRPNN